MRSTVNSRVWLVGATLLGFILAAFVAVEGQECGTPSKQKAIVVAVLPFSHASKSAQYEPLAEAMGEMIAACLGNSKELTFVDRRDLDKVLREHEITLSGIVDAKTKIEVGKLLGASHVLTGAVTVVGKRLRINAHLFEVDSARLLRSESAKESIEKLLLVVHAVAAELAKDLNFELPEIKEEDIDKSPEANLHFMRGLGLYYTGRLDHAIAEFMKTAHYDSTHTKARLWTAKVYMQTKEYEHARIELNEIIGNSPKSEEASHARKLLQQCEEHLKTAEARENKQER
jgi:TolB-like protein